MLLNSMEVIGTLSQGMIYAILALGVFLSFRTLNIPDLTVDGSVVTGAAVSAVVCSLNGNPLLGLFLAFIAGCMAGSVTALLNTKLKIQPLLAGILVMLALYSVNLHIMGKPNISLTMNNTIYKSAAKVLPETYSAIMVGFVFLVLIIIAFYFFLKTRLGFALRATGDNEDMVRSYAIDSEKMKILGLALSNGFVGLAGGLLAQYQSFADTTMGTGMVVIGLASVILGEAIFGTKSLFRRLIAVSLGAILYRFAITYAFHLGLPVNDLKLVSAVIVIGALAIGTFSESFPFKLVIGKKEV
ncbi:ABC transporter permease [Clostridium aminobutyricum]|uniref:ABC transporter permease n=1 Tax=Clostridium aminobutyricum TaxID=33953 RepID=A0A939D8P0_CLOAM|nr:ABC transporter permease [Clostridium aminobutyricum]MBN7773181.1 ABC transporter permease [Clostridium aminobutyricum]